MATPFSWSDTINIAFGTCLPCLKPALSTGEDQEHDIPHNSAINRIPRARADELQGLLADPDTDIEAETLSLHSNPGRDRRSKKKRRPRTKKTDGNPRRITLFGYDLFGRPTPPPIQLPTDDDALYDSGRRPRSGSESGRLTPNTTVTASTFDSDAAPLDADAIDAMSSPTAIATAAAQAADAEAQRLREKEERRQRRREKKELRRLAEALAAQGIVGDGEEAFEGFQGSGSGAPVAAGGRSGYPRIPDTMLPRGPTSDSGSGSGSAFSGSGGGGFGPFVEAPAQANEDDDGAADLDGGMYARRAARAAPAGASGSDSHSRTSASLSDRAHQLPDPRAIVAHLQAQAFSSSRVASPSPLQAQFQPHRFDSASSVSESFVTAESNATSVPPAKSKKSKSSSSRTSRSHSSTTASQSPSLPSPISPAFSNGAQDAAVVSPSTIEHGQGFFDLDNDAPVRRSRNGSSAIAGQFTKNEPEGASAFPAARIGGGPREGFPSTGFGGAGAGRARDLGVFLSRRGEDEETGDGL